MCVTAGANMVFFQGRRFSSVAPASPAVAVAVPGVKPQPAAIPAVQSPVQASSATETERTTKSVTRTEGGLSPTGSIEPIAEAGEFPMSRMEIVRGVQKGLAARGYLAGAADGVAGLATRAAIMAYEYDNGLVMTAEPSRELMKHILVGGAGPAAARRGAPEIKGSEAAGLTRTVAQQLAAAGYPSGRSDGSFSPQLVQAIRTYEAVQKMPVTGRISAPLVAKLAKASAAGKTAAR